MRLSLVALAVLIAAPALAEETWQWEESVADVLARPGARAATKTEASLYQRPQGDVLVVAPMQLAGEDTLARFHFADGSLRAVVMEVPSREANAAVLAETESQRGAADRYVEGHDRHCRNEQRSWTLSDDRTIVSLRGTDCGADIDPGTFELGYFSTQSD